MRLIKFDQPKNMVRRDFRLTPKRSNFRDGCLKNYPLSRSSSGYLPDHIPTWFMMSKMTPFFKSPVTNLLCPPSHQLLLSQPNHVWSWSSFQDISHIIYEHDLGCKRWTHPSSSKSGTINVLQVHNSAFLSQIVSHLDQTFKIGSLENNHFIFNVQLNQILLVSSQEQWTSSKHKIKLLSLKKTMLWSYNLAYNKLFTFNNFFAL